MKLGLQDVLGNFDFVFYKMYDVGERRSLKIKKIIEVKFGHDIMLRAGAI